MMNGKLETIYAIPGAVTICPGQNDLPKVVLTHPSGASAEVYLHGAHLTSWVPAGGQEHFFVSRQSYFTPDKPIRGGIPVIFPQFGGDGPLPQHGFARTSAWTLAESAQEAAGDVTIALQLVDTPETRVLWPYAFNMLLRIRLTAKTLQVETQVDNTGTEPFDFQCALHTYFAVADIHHTTVAGLILVKYLDSLQQNRREVERRPSIPFAEETDRIYVDAPNSLMVFDAGAHRVTLIEKVDMPDVVVWNPWIAKSQRMVDFGDDEYLNMVCVETGIIAVPRRLAAGASWQGVTTFSGK